MKLPFVVWDRKLREGWLHLLEFMLSDDAVVFLWAALRRSGVATALAAL